MKYITLIKLALLLSVFFGMSPETFSQKLTAEEIVEKHIESIGKKEDLDKAKSRVFVGTGKLKYLHFPSSDDTGVVQFASNDNKSIFAIIFNYVDYPHEKAAYNGKKVTIGQPRTLRTLFGQFLRANDAVLEQGLFGGVLNSNWPLLQLKERKLKVSYGGKGSWNNSPAYKLKFNSKTGGLNITLYIDQTTFRHIGSEYKYTVEVRIGSTGTNPATGPSYFSMIESYADFKTTNGLTIPTKMLIHLSESSTESTESQEFRLNFYEAYFDQNLSDDVFSVS